MIVSTTPTLEGKRVREYLGLVVGEAIVGANVFKDLFASIRDIVGGRSGAYEQELQRARDIALQDMVSRRGDGRECNPQRRSGLRSARAGRLDADGDGKRYSGCGRVRALRADMCCPPAGGEAAEPAPALR